MNSIRPLLCIIVTESLSCRVLHPAAHPRHTDPQPQPNLSRPYSCRGVCTTEQRNKGRDAIMNFDRGALGLTPCQLHNFLKGRTLWIVG